MSESSGRERVTMIHDMVLRLAGKLPDDLVTQARRWLAAGQEGDLAKALAFAVVDQQVPVIPDDSQLLKELLDDIGADPDVMDTAELAGAEVAPPYMFTPVAPDTDDSTDVPAGEPADDVERAAAAAAAEEPAARGMWRVWRTHAYDTPWPPPRRVFLVEVDSTADVTAVTGRVQDRLAAAGETAPQVEVFSSDTELPAYQRLAWAYGVLLWTRAGQPEIKIAVVFDEVDPDTGPRFTAQHPRVEDEAERGRLAGYLRAGTELLITTARMDDVVDTSRVASVPMNFRTDGTWIWTDTALYYLEEHLLEPDPALVAHIRDSFYTAPDVDSVAIHRALTVLQEPPEEEPVWTHNGGSDGSES